MPKSRFIRVATEGATTDGRRIERSWISEMAANYDPKKYQARVNMEHIRGFTADGPFKAYGDVLALKADAVEDGKLALFAQIDATDELVEINRQRQKLFTSVEIAEKFADTGQAYLVGLAVTDSPASLGLEVLEFASKNPAASPFTARKQNPANLFSAAEQTTLELETDPGAVLTPPAEAGLVALLSRVFAPFGQNLSQTNGQPAAVKAPEPAPAARTDGTDPAALFGMLNGIHGALTQMAAASDAARGEDRKAFAELKREFDAFKTQLGGSEAPSPTRPLANGATAGAMTDC